MSSDVIESAWVEFLSVLALLVHLYALLLVFSLSICIWSTTYRAARLVKDNMLTRAASSIANDTKCTIYAAMHEA